MGAYGHRGAGEAALDPGSASAPKEADAGGEEGRPAYKAGSRLGVAMEALPIGTTSLVLSPMLLHLNSGPFPNPWSLRNMSPL